MNLIDEEKQMLAVDRVLEEIKTTEQHLLDWNAFWNEKYEDVVFPRKFFEKFSWDKEEYDTEIAKIDLKSRVYENYGFPLRRIALDHEHSVDINKILWNDIVTRNAIRQIQFHNNGDIFLEKNSNNRSRSISYSANFNVLTDNFQLFITSILQNKNNNYNIVLNDNLLFMRNEILEIYEDLDIGDRIFKIADQDFNDFVFSITLNKDNDFNSLFMSLTLEDDSNVINGTYNLYVDKQNNVRAYFYSKGGRKIDLTYNSFLLDKFFKLINEYLERQDVNPIIFESMKCIKRNFDNDTCNEEIIFDFNIFDMNVISMIENTIVEVVKNIRGEIPIDGLVSRIDNYLDIVNKRKNKKEPKLVLKNN